VSELAAKPTLKLKAEFVLDQITSAAGSIKDAITGAIDEALNGTTSVGGGRFNNAIGMVDSASLTQQLMDAFNGVDWGSVGTKITDGIKTALTAGEDVLGPIIAQMNAAVAAHAGDFANTGALILASEKAIKQYGLTPLARFVSFAARGVPPEIMGIGPIEAIPAALKYAGLSLADMGWIELNEAFAAQSLAVINSVGLDPAKVNPMGGAIALGHPLGATGAIRAATVVHALRRHNLKYGMVTMCVGTGQGAAGIFERV